MALVPSAARDAPAASPRPGSRDPSTTVWPLRPNRRATSSRSRGWRGSRRLLFRPFRPSLNLEDFVSRTVARDQVDGRLANTESASEERQ